jgi:Domain of unknown function (DUF4440)
MPDEELLEQLLTLERRGWQSLCDGTGDKFYGQIMTDDALMVLANGATMDRAAVTSALAQAPPWARYDISDARLVSVGAKSAALVYVGTGHRDSGAPFVGAMSSVYRRLDDEWKLVLYQQTAID